MAKRQNSSGATCSAEVWAQLIEIADRYELAKAEEEEAIKGRDDTFLDIGKLETKQGTKYDRLCGEYFQYLNNIKSARAKQKSLPDHFTRAVHDGVQGKLADLTAPEPDDDEGEDEGSKLPYRDPADKLLDRRKVAAAMKDAEAPEWYAFTVGHLSDARGVSEATVAALAREGIHTLGDVMAFMRTTGRLTKLAGITPGGERQIEEAMESIDPDWFKWKSTSRGDDPRASATASGESVPAAVSPVPGVEPQKTYSTRMQEKADAAEKPPSGKKRGRPPGKKNTKKAAK